MKKPKPQGIVRLFRRFGKKIKHLRAIAKKHWQCLVVLGVILLAVLVYYVVTNPMAWVVKSSFTKSETYPYATFLGNNAGNLDKRSLSLLLSKTKAIFESHTYTFQYGNARWHATAQDLGFTLDVGSTEKAIWRLNNLSLGDKARLIRDRKNGHNAVKPILVADSKKCQQLLTTLVTVNKAPVDAKIYYDGQIKVKPDESGVALQPADTCRGAEKTIQNGQFAGPVAVNTTPANITNADTTAALGQVNGMAGRPIAFTASGYTRTVKPDELLSLVVLSKPAGKSLAVTWDDGRLDALAADIASHIDTFISPAVGSCQVVVSPGGTRLDRQFVKDTVKGLDGSKPASYNLRTYSVAPQVRNRSAATGTKGTVYLTYDDGMDYAGTIMDYAACYNIKVTFFEIGSRANADAAMLRRAVAEGHTVQSHGYIHALYDYGTGHDYAWQFGDIQQSIDVITSITGVRPTYFRPPGGNHTATTSAAAAANNIKMILWDVSSEDTSNNTTAAICQNVVSRARAGYAVLMHSVKQKTANALPCIAEGLAAHGYSMQALR